MKKILFSSIFVVLLFPLFDTKAQVTDSPEPLDIVSSGISIDATPNFPGPHEDINVTLSSFSVDADISVITWSVNGKVVSSGQGLKSIDLTTGDLGSTMVVSATIKAKEGTYTKTVTISVGSVDLLWQGEGYTPPFYKGRTLWGHQTQLTLLAIPNVGKNPSTLLYRWYLDGEVAGYASGVGKNSFSIVDSILGRPRTIKVEVMSDRNTVLATASTVQTSTGSSVLIYENNSLYGTLFNKEVSAGFSTKNPEFSFVGLPLFFNTHNRNSSNITYAWQATGGEVKNTSSVTYRVPPNTAGSSLINLQLNNPREITESAGLSFTVQFDNTRNL